MTRLLLAIAFLAGLTCAGQAQTVEDRLKDGLKDQGYVILEDGYTFLGRLRIVAQSDRYRREIVVNPGTGEVLRDYVVQRSDPQPPAPAAGGASDATAATTTGAAEVDVGSGIVTDPGQATDVTVGANTGIVPDGTVAVTGQTETGTKDLGRIGGVAEVVVSEPAVSVEETAP